MTTIAITGASGYVGGTLARGLERRGLNVVRLGRAPGTTDRHFTLNEAPSPGLLDGVDGLIHCAWDVHARRPDAHRTNVLGSIALLDLARVSGVKSIVFISSMAAFPACRSDHGRTKLEVEAAVAERGGTVVRPGLLYSHEAGGLFRTLEGLIRASRLVPVVGGAVKLPLLHMDDLTELTYRLVLNEAASPPVVSAAYPERVAFRTVLRTIAACMGRGTTFVPVPATLVFAGLKVLEACGLSPRTGSDNLVSLLNQNPHPDLTAEIAGIRFRPFNAATLAQ
jgi:nucleoside-diphosphate-sugar epimerase